MKLSVSVTEDDVQLMDRFASSHGLPSRSSVVQYAIRALGNDALADDYAAAFTEWDGSTDAVVWEQSVADGARDAAG